jgi:hypothetical protein
MAVTRAWRWRVAGGEPVAATIELPIRIEAVRVGAVEVSRSEPGGKAGGHAFRLGDAAAVVTFEADGEGCALTLDGDWVPPEAEPTTPPSGTMLERLRGAPRWTWAFVGCALVVPIASRGAVVPTVVAVVAAAGCAGVPMLRVPTALKVLLSFCALGVSFVALVVALLAQRGALGDGALAHAFGGGDPCRVARDELLLLHATPGAAPRAPLRLPRATCPRLAALAAEVAVRGGDGAVLYRAADGIHRFDPYAAALTPPLLPLRCQTDPRARVEGFLTAPDSDRVVYWCSGPERAYVDANGPHLLGDAVRPLALGAGGRTLLLGPREPEGDRFLIADADDARHDVFGLPRMLDAVTARARDDGFWLLRTTQDAAGHTLRQVWTIDRDGGAILISAYANGPSGPSVDRLGPNADVYATYADPPRVLRFPYGGGEPEVLYERANDVYPIAPVVVAPP